MDPLPTEPQIADSPLDLIGNTPLVRLARIGAGLSCQIVAKLETTNPGGSVKDRPAVAMIDAAERDGTAQAGRHDRRADLGQHRRRPRHRRRAARLPLRLRGDRQGGAREDRSPAGLWRRGRRLPGGRRAVGPELVLRDGRAPRARDRRRVPPEPVRQPVEPVVPRADAPVRRSGGRRPAGSPTSSPASAPAGPSPAWPATSRPRTRRCRSSAPTRRVRCTRAAPAGRTSWKAWARTSGPRRTTRRSSTA